MKYIREFEGLRGVMALWVLVGHWASTLAFTDKIFVEKFYNIYAVDIFIMLSGFAIASMIDQKPEPYFRYITRRFFRIFPVYLFFLAISVAVAHHALLIWQNSPEGSMKASRVAISIASLRDFYPHILVHITGLHSMVPERILQMSSYAFLGQAWSVSLEWQFYLIAPFLIFFFMRFNNTTAKALIATAGFACMFWLSRYFPNGFLGSYLHEFVIGIVSYFVLSFLGAPKEKEVAAFIWPAFTVSALILIFTDINHSVPYIIWLFILCSILKGHLLSGDKVSGIVTAFLNSRQMQWIGKMAYSIYLSHMLVLLGAVYLLEKLSIDSPYAQAAFLLALTAPVTLVISHLAYKFIEAPAHRFGKSLWAK